MPFIPPRLGAFASVAGKVCCVNVNAGARRWSPCEQHIYLVLSESYRAASCLSVSMENKTNPSCTDCRPPLPDWWKVPDPKRFPNQVFLFRALCLVSVARTTVDQYWQSVTDDDEWEKQKSKIMSRLCNTNIVTGLMLTTSAVFISTQPPLTSFLPYTLRGSYIFAFLSFTHALGGLICGLAVVNIYDACDRTWVKDVLTASRFRLCCTLIFISWPSISLTISITYLTMSEQLSLCRDISDVIPLHRYSDRMLCSRSVVGSMLGHARGLILGVDATSLCLVCSSLRALLAKSAERHRCGLYIHMQIFPRSS
ncbi:hypothetical protein DFH29DRAFT_197345 [Suillus ampliporus]|nr:hypothetical protein DFH29DRAFT_197345 [Suillus ampliporus]